MQPGMVGRQETENGAAGICGRARPDSERLCLTLASALYLLPCTTNLPLQFGTQNWPAQILTCGSPPGSATCVNTDYDPSVDILQPGELHRHKTGKPVSMFSKRGLMGWGWARQPGGGIGERPCDCGGCTLKQSLCIIS